MAVLSNMVSAIEKNLAHFVGFKTFIYAEELYHQNGTIEKRVTQAAVSINETPKMYSNASELAHDPLTTRVYSMKAYLARFLPTHLYTILKKIEKLFDQRILTRANLMIAVAGLAKHTNTSLTDPLFQSCQEVLSFSIFPEIPYGLSDTPAG